MQTARRRRQVSAQSPLLWCNVLGNVGASPGNRGALSRLVGRCMSYTMPMSQRPMDGVVVVVGRWQAGRRGDKDGRVPFRAGLGVAVAAGSSSAGSSGSTTQAQGSTLAGGKARRGQGRGTWLMAACRTRGPPKKDLRLLLLPCAGPAPATILAFGLQVFDPLPAALFHHPIYPPALATRLHCMPRRASVASQ